MDYGPDSYATQSFYIDEGDYEGKKIAISWFSGVPDAPASINAGALGAARKGWNGGGMTIPVEFGLKKSGEGYLLTQTPIVRGSENFEKTPVKNAQGENVLANLNTHCFELEADISNPEESPVYFRINMRGGEYTEIGWNAEEGYYVSREHTGDAGLNLGNYRSRHTSGAVGGKELSFYILSDNGGVEVFCGGFTIPFYVLTFSSPYATKAQFSAEGEVEASIRVNAISSVWRDDAGEGETVLHVEEENVELDRTLTPEREIIAYSTAGGEIEWSVESGEGVVSLEKTESGAKLTALSAGTAIVKAVCGNAVKTINVTVHAGTVDSDISFKSEGIVSGKWYAGENGLLGVQSAGDGFILSETGAEDFTYSVNFGLSGAAAAAVFRAKADMSDYLIANYDDNGKIVKLWSPRGEIARADAAGIDASNIILKVKAEGKRITVYLNGREVINAELGEGEPLEGLFGLNVCAARVTFKSIVIIPDGYDYAGGSLTVGGEAEQAITAVYNRVYEFTAVGSVSSFTFSVNVAEIPVTEVGGVTVDYGCNAVIYIGNNMADALAVNGEALNDGYSVKNGVLTISAEKLSVGENTVTINGGLTVTVTVNPQAVTAEAAESDNLVLIISLSVTGGVLVLGGAAAAAVIIILRKKKNGNDN